MNVTEAKFMRAVSRRATKVAGVEIHALREEEVIRHIVSESLAGRGGWVATHNLDHVRRLRRDRRFAEVCATATLRVADGMPIVWAGRIAGAGIPERVAGSSMIFTLSAAAARAGRSIYLLGGNPGTAERAAEVLQERNPGLRVVGTDCPAPGFEQSPQALREVLDRVAAAQPDIVYVALGSPKQEYLIRDLLQVTPNAWFIGVGISFSFICGEVRRAPRWVQRIGLEWLHRLAQEPRRLARRYLIDGLPFAVGLFAAALGQRLGGRGRGTADTST